MDRIVSGKDLTNQFIFESMKQHELQPKCHKNSNTKRVDLVH